MSEFERREGIVGWVRADQSIDTGPLTSELSRLAKENNELRSQNLSSQSNIQPMSNGLEYLELKKLMSNEIPNVKEFQGPQKERLENTLKSHQSNPFNLINYFLLIIDY